MYGTEYSPACRAGIRWSSTNGSKYALEVPVANVMMMQVLNPGEDGANYANGVAFRKFSTLGDPLEELSSQGQFE